MEENKQHKTALPETEPIPSAQAPEALLDIRGLRVESTPTRTWSTPSTAWT